jgi:hypothetical protein
MPAAFSRSVALLTSFRGSMRGRSFLVILSSCSCVSPPVRSSPLEETNSAGPAFGTTVHKSVSANRRPAIGRANCQRTVAFRFGTGGRVPPAGAMMVRPLSLLQLYSSKYSDPWSTAAQASNAHRLAQQAARVSCKSRDSAGTINRSAGDSGAPASGIMQFGRRHHAAEFGCIPSLNCLNPPKPFPRL